MGCFQGMSGLQSCFGEPLSPAAVGAQLQARTLGCKAPEELSTAFPEWAGCNFIPENLHPKSFRGYIGHNTNVWAAASRAGIKVRPLVPGVIAFWLGAQEGALSQSQGSCSPHDAYLTRICAGSSCLLCNVLVPRKVQFAGGEGDWCGAGGAAGGRAGPGAGGH